MRQRVTVGAIQVHNNVYTYPNLSFVVRAGDILGAYQPQDMESVTNLVFQNSSGYLSYFVEGVTSPSSDFDVSGTSAVIDLPLIAVEASGKPLSLYVHV